MEQTFSRRGFLKGAAAAALAVSAMGLTGCSTDAGAEPSTAVILGDYKVDLDLKRSVLGKNGDGSATVKLSGQTAVYTLNFGTLTKTVEKIG